MKQQKVRNKFVYEFISFVLFLSMTTVVPSVLKHMWPNILNISARLGQVDVWMFVIIGMSANLLSIIFNNLFMLFVYATKIRYFQQFRVSPEKPWPWQSDPSWRRKLCKTLALVLFNAIFVNFLLSFGQSYVHKLRYSYRLQDWPSTLRILSRFAIFFVYNQIISWIAHYAFHHPLLYPIHKIHHEYTISISLTATYAHPIEYIFSNLLSTALCVPIASVFVDVHLVQVFVWVYFRLMETIEVHSGYDFPWGCLGFMPGKNRVNFHDFHHSHNVGTYGSMLRYMDSLMGTDKQFNKYYLNKQ